MANDKLTDTDWARIAKLVDDYLELHGSSAYDRELVEKLQTFIAKRGARTEPPIENADWDEPLMEHLK